MKIIYYNKLEQLLKSAKQMSDQPLYYPRVTPRIGDNNNKDKEKPTFKHAVNPMKIVPNISKQTHLQTQSKKQQTLLFTGLGKQKKINKSKNTYNEHKHFRTKMCPMGRDCKKRFTCTFAHTENELRKPFIKRKNPCKLFQRGQCSLGSACRDYHGNIDLQKNYKYKEKVCEELRVTGNCSKGILCIFSHEKQENEQPEIEDNEQSGEKIKQEAQMEGDCEKPVNLEKVDEKKKEASGEEKGDINQEQNQEDFELLFIPL